MADKCQGMLSLGRLTYILFHCRKLCNFREEIPIRKTAQGIQPLKISATFPVCRPNICWCSTMI